MWGTLWVSICSDGAVIKNIYGVGGTPIDPLLTSGTLDCNSKKIKK